MKKIRLGELAIKIWKKLRKNSVKKIVKTMKNLSSCIYLANSFRYARASYLY